MRRADSIEQVGHLVHRSCAARFHGPTAVRLIRKFTLALRRMAGKQADRLELLDCQAGAQTIVHVVIVIGDLIGQIAYLRFEGRAQAVDEAAPSSPSLAASRVRNV